MSFSRYPDYKQSGIPWVKDVPSHWIVSPLMGIANERLDSNIGMRERNLLSLSYGRIIRKDIESNDGLLPESFETYQIVQQGDVVLRLTDLQNDKRSLRSAQVNERGIITSAYLALQPTRIDPNFFSYLLRGYDHTKVFYSMGGGLRQSLKFSDMKRLPVAVPSKEEQSSIVAFLNHETAKIDALVDEQKRLIELLKEKRHAVVSRAVTKGLNPTVLLKESRVEWLGNVPAHWTPMPIRLAARLESGHTPSRSRPDWWVDCTVPWFTLADVWQIRSGVDVVHETKEMVSELGLANSSARLLPKGTVMLSRTASVGFSAIMGVAMATTQDFANWVCGKTLLPEFLLCVFRSMSGEFRRLMMGSTHNTIYMPDIQAFRFALPPIDEQRAIVAYVRRTTDSFEALTTEAEKGVELLIERRSALISAAVTGKIDVRAWRKQAELEPA